MTGGGQKVLAPINGRSFLSILIDYITSQGGHRFIVCTGHGAQDVEDHFQELRTAVEIIFSKEDTPLGTGGAIKKASTKPRIQSVLSGMLLDEQPRQHLVKPLNWIKLLVS